MQSNEAVEAVSFWLSPENVSARRQLQERSPELGAWLDLVEKKVQERLAQAESEISVTKNGEYRTAH